MSRKISIFRFANFVNCFCFWIAMPIISMVVMGQAPMNSMVNMGRAGQSWIITYLLILGLFSIGVGIISTAIHGGSSRFFIGFAAICNLFFFIISLIHAGLAAEKLSKFHQQLKYNDDPNPQQILDLSLLFNAIVVVSMLNGKTISF